jgi:hypothetical protein
MFNVLYVNRLRFNVKPHLDSFFLLQEELDTRLLLIQNKKLAECVQNYRKAEVEWKAKVDLVERKNKPVSIVNGV